MKRVHYHQHGKEPIVLHVVAENKDGTVDLAREPEGEAIITGMTLSDKPAHGAAVPLEAEAPVTRKPAAKKAAKTKPEGDKTEGDKPEGDDPEGDKTETEGDAPPFDLATGDKPTPPPDE